MTKAGVRKYIFDLRADMDKDVKKIKDEKIYSSLIGSQHFNEAKCIFAFVSFQNEVNTHKFIDYALKQGKTLAVPLVISKERGMAAVVIDSLKELRPNKMGILEPENYEGKILNPNEIDLMIVPGLAFEKSGGRIGYGGGFYDRYIPKLKKDAVKIGVAYDFQILDSIPMYEHDMKVDYVITA
ncbi:5-formyltetrahydrofolate cyclo-ligase [Clostridium sp. 19966]|uniref:5-formyltetrahydrofolate cyclo-ligase n=1 Tax=Clostridium sp. 19966 TaxID=2768166 RepID=UPI0028E05BFD|nr:5-formyltetrahydrofolate cyclo-ligase [Clostridium sp. 19966]MDT8715222.1 5-formyltetrahydrofolate cyclo-ligase [Clostridium sp. 19966]